MAEIIDETSSIESTTVGVYRTSSTVAGGRRFSFSAMVVVGDRRGRAGVGYAKSNQVPTSIEKAQKEGRRKMLSFQLQGKTIPHLVVGRYGATTVKLIPAAPGTGVIAGAAVRAEHVTVKRDRALAHRIQINHRTHRPADEALDLHAAAIGASVAVALVALLAASGKHRIFGGQPSLPAVLEKRRHAVFDRRGDQHVGVPHLDETGPLGVLGEPAFERHGSKFVVLSSINALHEREGTPQR